MIAGLAIALRQFTSRRRGVTVGLLAISGLACPTRVPVLGHASGSTEVEPSETTGDDTESTSGTIGSDDTQTGDYVFIARPDLFSISFGCDVWTQDCPEGKKCMPWANDGGPAWNALHCTPLDPHPAQLGEPCRVVDSGVSGIDNCDVASMCWDVDGETLEGTCVALCIGSPAKPICEDPATACFRTASDVLNLCVSRCDPIVQDCDPGLACSVIDGATLCMPDASGLLGAYGDACVFGGCDPGLECARAERVPGCTSEGCCTSYCDLTDPNASARCEGAAEGQACVPRFTDADVRPGFEHVGICSLVP